MQKRKGKRGQDPSAPVDPTNMTLNDLIWQAHTHATAKEQEYQKALAEKKAHEAEDAEKKKQQAQNTAVENLPAAPAEPAPAVASTSFAPRLVMRNGKIAVDEQSLTVQVRPPPLSNALRHCFLHGSKTWVCACGKSMARLRRNASNCCIVPADAEDSSTATGGARGRWRDAHQLSFLSATVEADQRAMGQGRN